MSSWTFGLLWKGGERTTGHYQFARLCADFLGAADPALVLEARGLSTAQPGSRPGDIFTSAALPNRYAALDVTVVSQRAGHAGEACVATAYHTHQAPQLCTHHCGMAWGRQCLRPSMLEL